MKTINIEGKDFTIDELVNIIEQAKKAKDPMEEVYAYHKTTKEDFDRLWGNMPAHTKAYEKECMVVEFYNKGWSPNWSDSNEKKYYVYLNMKNGTFNDWICYYSTCFVPARLCLRTKEDLLDMAEKFLDVIKESRLG